ncbi:hypothetical protein Q8791_14115 [Nocardiopsis sp. CT-R113]|uniref:Uncharacterized protein n=1 Tax=Nocardiopsis codii TaxID=3065942 RepID=A0ABU7K7Z6_9ACTN|nr:hypothetical protein [Nocardiopsis sp. CT-R113]MEE2038356.1 hypothetical protein [Nocardiopsis sp. CT-R113]
MSRLLNDTTTFREDVLTGPPQACGRFLERVDGASGVLRRPRRRGRAAVGLGGGAGHYPAFAGLVGPEPARRPVRGWSAHELDPASPAGTKAARTSAYESGAPDDAHGPPGAPRTRGAGGILGPTGAQGPSGAPGDTDSEERPGAAGMTGRAGTTGPVEGTGSAAGARARGASQPPPAAEASGPTGSFGEAAP